MTKWEYLEVQVVSTLGGRNGDATHFKPDGKHIQRNDKLGLLLAQLGLEGGELVAPSPRGDTNNSKMNYVFKSLLKET